MSGRFNLNDYVTVDERIDRFWAQYPNGAIRTEMLYTNNDGSNVAIKASVYKDWEHPHSNPDATGIAQELQGGANANKSSWWENCETSAIGRALANLGMSISKQRPSREEMAKVQRYQDDDGNSAARGFANTQPAPASASFATNAPQQPAPAAPAANGRTLSPGVFEQVIDACWMDFENGKPLDAIKEHLNNARPHMSEAQRLVARQQLTKLEEAIAERAAPSIAG